MPRKLTHLVASVVMMGMLALYAPLAALAQNQLAPIADASSTDAASQQTPVPNSNISDETISAERQRIANGRAAASQRYSADQRDCWQRFMVNACLEKARERRRETLGVLRHDELLLNAQERARRTSTRLEAIAGKQAEKPNDQNLNQDATPSPAPAP